MKTEPTLDECRAKVETMRIVGNLRVPIKGGVAHFRPNPKTGLAEFYETETTKEQNEKPTPTLR